MGNKILNFTQKRNESIEKKRRDFERVIFQRILGAYSELNSNGTIYSIDLIDISLNGCLFQIPSSENKSNYLKIGEELTIRMYFSEKRYISVIVEIKYMKEIIDNDGSKAQYGCEFDKSMPSFEAIKHFINFLYAFAEHSSYDQGDSEVFFL